MGCVQSTSGKAAEATAERRVGLKHTHVSIADRMHEEWNISDKDKDGKLDKKEVQKLLHRLNLEVTSRVVDDAFKEFDADGNGTLDYEEFTKFFRSIQSLPDVVELFHEACGMQVKKAQPSPTEGKNQLKNDQVVEGGMRAHQLQKFLASASDGRVDPSLFEVAKLIYKSMCESQEKIDSLVEEKDPAAQFAEEPILTYEGFQRLLMDGQANSAFDERKIHQVYQDMTQPLSSYFISSSHNSYLSGNQLSSESSAAVIARALKMGVRVIELDAWDGPDGKPIVNHGHTMCKPVPFVDCLEAIRDEAFTASQYPVIITIENHCSFEQQAVQAEMLQSTFGAALYRWEGVVSDEGKTDWKRGPDRWKSPEDLKGKIVIRDKPIKKKKEKKEKKKSGGKKQSAAKKETEVLEAVEVQVSMDLDDDAEDDDDAAMEAIGCHEDLLKMMYIKNVKLKFTVDKEKCVVEYVEPDFKSSSSIVEGKMLKLTKPGYHVNHLYKYALDHLVRVYPAGSRVDSSNYDPTPAWVAGLQVVALNYQTFSLPVWLNQGRFLDNGGSGYILKPEYLLDSKSEWDGTCAEETLKLKITLHSGHYFPKPLGKSERSEVIDPYVEIAIHGIEADCAKHASKAVDDNGFNPKWNEEFEFTVRQPDLALISFVVYDHDLVGKDDLIAQTVAPVSTLIPGYKLIPLKYGNGAPCYAYLFAQIHIAR